MNEIIKNAVEEYQCPGCVCGNDIECYQEGEGIECKNHVVGTMIISIGRILLGMPKGFNRLGSSDKIQLKIYESYESFDWKYDKWNIPTWKHLDKNGNTLIRGHQPRLNQTFLHVFLEDCLDIIDCLEITQDDIDQMD